MDGPPKKKQRVVEKPYATWTYDERIILIETRIKFDTLFTSKNANISAGWRKVLENCGDKLGRDKSYIHCKQQWSVLMKKYKSFFKINTGEGAGDEAPEEKQAKEDWPFFETIDKHARCKDNFHPPLLMASSKGLLVNKPPIDTPSASPMPSTSSQGYVSPESPTPSTSSESRSNLESPTPSTSSRGCFRSRTAKDCITTERYLAIREKRDKKMDKKINGLLSIYGQMVRQDYPNINVDILLISSGSESE